MSKYIEAYGAFDIAYLFWPHTVDFIYVILSRLQKNKRPRLQILSLICIFDIYIWHKQVLSECGLWYSHMFKARIFLFIRENSEILSVGGRNKNKKIKKLLSVKLK